MSGFLPRRDSFRPPLDRPNDYVPPRQEKGDCFRPEQKREWDDDMELAKTWRVERERERNREREEREKERDKNRDTTGDRINWGSSYRPSVGESIREPKGNSRLNPSSKRRRSISSFPMVETSSSAKYTSSKNLTSSILPTPPTSASTSKVASSASLSRKSNLLPSASSSSSSPAAPAPQNRRPSLLPDPPSWLPAKPSVPAGGNPVDPRIGRNLASSNPNENKHGCGNRNSGDGEGASNRESRGSNNTSSTDIRRRGGEEMHGIPTAPRAMMMGRSQTQAQSQAPVQPRSQSQSQSQPHLATLASAGPPTPSPSSTGSNLGPTSTPVKRSAWDLAEEEKKNPPPDSHPRESQQEPPSRRNLKRRASALEGPNDETKDPRKVKRELKGESEKLPSPPPQAHPTPKKEVLSLELVASSRPPSSSNISLETKPGPTSNASPFPSTSKKPLSQQEGPPSLKQPAVRTDFPSPASDTSILRSPVDRLFRPQPSQMGPLSMDVEMKDGEGSGQMKVPKNEGNTRPKELSPPKPPSISIAQLVDSDKAPLSMRCNKCNDLPIPKMAIVINCQSKHVYCANHIPVFDSTTPRCPVVTCQSPVYRHPHRSFSGTDELLLYGGAADVNDLIAGLQLRCLAQASGCRWLDNASGWENHWLQCSYITVPCQYCGVLRPRGSMSNHHLRECSKFAMPCPRGGEKCGGPMDRGVSSKHRNVCQWYKCACLCQGVVGTHEHIRQHEKEMLSKQQALVQERDAALREADTLRAKATDASTSLQEKITEHSKATDKWRIQMQSCRTTLDQKQIALSNQTKQAAKEKKRADDAERVLKSLDQQGGAETKRCDELCERLEKQDKLLSSKVTEIETLKLEVKGGNEAKSRLLAERVRLQSSLTEAISSNEKSTVDMGQLRSSSEAEIDALQKASAEELERLRKFHKKQLSELQSSFHETQRQLQEEKNKLQCRLAVAEQFVETAQNQTELKIRLEHQVNACQQRETEIESLKNEIASWRETEERLVLENRERTAELESVQKVLSATRTQFQSSLQDMQERTKAEQDQLRSRLTDAEKCLQTFREEEKLAQTLLSKSEQVQLSVEEERQRLRTERESLIKAEQGSKLAHGERDDIVSEANRQISNWRERCEILEAELQELRSVQPNWEAKTKEMSEGTGRIEDIKVALGEYRNWYVKWKEAAMELGAGCNLWGEPVIPMGFNLQKPSSNPSHALSRAEPDQLDHSLVSRSLPSPQTTNSFSLPVTPQKLPSTSLQFRRSHLDHLSGSNGSPRLEK